MWPKPAKMAPLEVKRQLLSSEILSDVWGLSGSSSSPQKSQKNSSFPLFFHQWMKGSSPGQPERERHPVRVPLAVKEGRLETKTPEFKAETGGLNHAHQQETVELTPATATHLLAVSAGLHQISSTDRKPNSTRTLLRQTAGRNLKLTSRFLLLSWNDHLVGGGEKQRDTSHRIIPVFPADLS